MIPKKSFIRWICLAFLVLEAVSGSPIYVDNTAINGDGTQSSPYSTFTQALNAAYGSSDIDTIVLTSGQTFADLTQSFQPASVLTFTSSSSSPAQITLSSNAQLTFSTADTFIFSNLKLLFSNSGLSSCSILASSKANLVLTQCVILASTTSSQLMPLICAEDSSTITVSGGSISSLNLLGSGSLFQANLSSTITIQTSSFSNSMLAAKAFEIYNSNLIIDDMTVTNLQITSESFIFVVSSAEQANVTIKASQFNAITSTSEGQFLNSSGNISNIELKSLSFGQITLPGGFVSIQGLGTQLKMDTVTMQTIISTVWFNISSAFLVEVTNCQFGNNASDFGSAFVIEEVYLVNVTLSVFNGINGSQYPSAMLVVGDNATLAEIMSQLGPVSFSQGFYVTSCIFKNLDGYYIDDSLLGGSFTTDTQTPAQVTNVTFLNNSYRYSGNPVLINAAPCIYVMEFDNQLWVSNSTFTGNHGRAFGGCIWAYAAEVIIQNSVFSYNTPLIDLTQGDNPIYGNSVGVGGALFLISGSLFVQNTTFQGNVRDSGGDVAFITTEHADALFTYGRNYSFEGCSFIGSTGNNGGNFAISTIASVNLTITNSVFTGTTYVTGGAIVTELLQDSVLLLINNTFMNMAGKSGGIVLHASPKSGQMIEIINCTAVNINNTLGGAGVFLLTGTTLNIQNSVFMGLIEEYAGAVLYSTGGQVTINNCTYSSGFATIGGIYLKGGSKLTITNSNFKNLQTMYDGALFYVDQDSTFYGENITASNIQTYVSGGIMTVMDNSVATFVNLNIIGVQGVIGTLFYVDQGSYLTLNSTTISTVQAQVSGIYVSGSSIITIENTSIQSFLGGTLLSLTNSSLIVNVLSIEAVKCTSETSICGISIDSSNSVSISSLSFAFMSTLGTYGAIALTSSVASISSSSFAYVSSPNTGSCIMITDANLSVSNSTFANTLGSCLYAQGGGNVLKVQDSTFNQTESTSGNLNQQMPFIQCQDFITLKIYNSSFSNSYVSSNGGALILSNSDIENPSSININETMFYANVAVGKGGAISLSNTKGNISNSNFVSNNALQSGGALHYNSTITNGVTLTNNTFSANNAGISGGVLFIDDAQLSLNDSTSIFSGNQAGYFGSEQASNPIRLGAQIINSDTGTTLYNYSVSDSSLSSLNIEASITLPYNFTFVALDQFGQIVSTLSPVKVTLDVQRVSSSTGQVGNYTINPMIRSLPEFYFTVGEISFSDLIVSSIVPDTVQLQVSVPSSAFIKPTTFSYYNFESYSGESYNYAIPLSIRDCFLGESKMIKIDQEYCRACPSGTYSFNSSDGNCNNCPDSAICYGGANTTVKSGFWRMNNYSIDIYECLIEDACPESIGYVCDLEYEGPLCQTCDESERTYKTSGGHCLKCPAYSISDPVFLMAALGYLLYFAFNIWVNIKAESDQMVETKGYLRILNGFFQLYSIAISAEFPAPDNLVYLIDLLSVGETSRCVSIFDCSFVNSSYPPVYVKTVFLCLLPLMWIGLFSTFMLVLKAFKKITNLRPFIRISSTTILYLLVPGLSKNLLLSLNCTNVDDQSVSSLSYALGCNESRFIVLKYTFILPCFFVWCIIIPMWSFISTHIKSKKAAGDNDPSIKLTLQLYKREQLDWDAIIYARFFAFGMISAFMGYDYYNKAVLTLGVLGISFYLMLSFRPYNPPQFNFLAMFELSIAILIILSAVHSSNLTNLNENPETVGFYVILMANIAFILSYSYLMIQSVCRKRRKIYPIKTKDDVSPPEDSGNPFKVNTAVRMEDLVADLPDNSIDLDNIPGSPIDRFRAIYLGSPPESQNNTKKELEFADSPQLRELKGSIQ